MSQRARVLTVVAVDVAAVVMVAWLAWATNQYGVPLAAGEVALPTFTMQGDYCGGVGLDAVLHGDAHDARVAWVTNTIPGLAYGDRMEVIWPRGYRARFTPNLVVLDEDDRPVIAEGDPVEGTCGFVDGAALLTPPFE